MGKFFVLNEEKIKLSFGVDAAFGDAVWMQLLLVASDA